MSGLRLFFLACGLRPRDWLKSLHRPLPGLLQETSLQLQADKPEKLFNASKELVAVFPKEKTCKLLIQQSIQQLNLASAHVERLRREMNELASTLPEYNTVMGIYGVGKTYGPQLIAEIGDVSRFTHREALTAFAGVDPSVDESGQHKSKSNRASKIGSARLRKTLF